MIRVLMIRVLMIRVRMRRGEGGTGDASDQKWSPRTKFFIAPKTSKPLNQLQP